MELARAGSMATAHFQTYNDLVQFFHRIKTLFISRREPTELQITCIEVKS